MFPGMNKKAVEQAMKKMGVKQEEIEAREVIIKTNDKTLVIRNPSVVKVNMMGQESLQITGEIEEENNEEDIKVIMEQASCSSEEAKKALEEKGDIAGAILKLKGNKS